MNKLNATLLYFFRQIDLILCLMIAFYTTFPHCECGSIVTEIYSHTLLAKIL